MRKSSLNCQRCISFEIVTASCVKIFRVQHWENELMIFFVTSFVCNTVTFAKLWKLSWTKFKKKGEELITQAHTREIAPSLCVITFSTSKNSLFESTVITMPLESMNQPSKCIFCYQVKWPTRDFFFLINVIEFRGH